MALIYDIDLEKLNKHTYFEGLNNISSRLKIKSIYQKI